MLSGSGQREKAGSSAATKVPHLSSRVVPGEKISKRHRFLDKLPQAVPRFCSVSPDFPLLHTAAATSNKSHAVRRGARALEGGRAQRDVDEVAAAAAAVLNRVVVPPEGARQDAVVGLKNLLERTCIVSVRAAGGRTCLLVHRAFFGRGQSYSSIAHAAAEQA